MMSPRLVVIGKQSGKYEPTAIKYRTHKLCQLQANLLGNKPIFFVTASIRRESSHAHTAAFNKAVRVKSLYKS